MGGCHMLPVTLEPMHGFNFPVSYMTDCVSTNELESLRITTSVGYFDAIMQGVCVCV